MAQGLLLILGASRWLGRPRRPGAPHGIVARPSPDDAACCGVGNKACRRWRKAGLQFLLKLRPVSLFDAAEYALAETWIRLQSTNDKTNHLA